MSARHTVEENNHASLNFEFAVIDFLRDYIGERTIFELGVGIGRFTRLLANIAARVVGCDISPLMLEQAKRYLEGCANVQLHLGKITEVPLATGERFDLVFDSIVLLHILSPTELRATIQRMMDLSDRIFIAEHTYEGPDFPISRYTILRTPEEYEHLFAPYKLVKTQTHYCAGDTFTLMLFESPNHPDKTPFVSRVLDFIKDKVGTFSLLIFSEFRNLGLTKNDDSFFSVKTAAQFVTYL